MVLLLGLVILGGWFFSGRGTNRRGSLLGWSGGIRLMALMFTMMVVVAFAIVISVQVFSAILFRLLTAKNTTNGFRYVHVGKIYNFGWSRLHSL